MDRFMAIWKSKDLRNSILFVLAMLVIFRLAAHIPVPGVNAVALKDFFNNNQVFGLINIFSGGGMQNFSIVMMGVGPFITSSIIFQLLGMIIPSLEEMNKEEAGRQKINMWTRWATIPLAAIQAFAMINLLRSSSAAILKGITPFDLFAIIVTITAGTMLLMWIGELISEKKIGNGISLLIFAGIIAQLPNTVQQFLVNYDSSMLFTIVGFIVIAIITIIGVVIINEGQRNIPVQYARQVRGQRAFGGSTTHLPLRVNMAGVIPIIFAISVILFPTMIAQFFIHANSHLLASIAQHTISLLQNQINLRHCLFCFGFCFYLFLYRNCFSSQSDFGKPAKTRRFYSRY